MSCFTFQAPAAAILEPGGYIPTQRFYSDLSRSSLLDDVTGATQLKPILSEDWRSRDRNSGSGELGGGGGSCAGRGRGLFGPGARLETVSVSHAQRVAGHVYDSQNALGGVLQSEHRRLPDFFFFLKHDKLRKNFPFLRSQNMLGSDT